MLVCFKQFLSPHFVGVNKWPEEGNDELADPGFQKVSMDYLQVRYGQTGN